MSCVASSRGLTGLGAVSAQGGKHPAHRGGTEPGHAMLGLLPVSAAGSAGGASQRVALGLVVQIGDPGGRALDAERIVAEDVYLDRGFAAPGEVRSNDAETGRQFNATGGEFRNDRSGAYALRGVV